MSIVKEKMDIWIISTLLLLRWMTMLIRQPMEKLVGKVLVHSLWSHEKLWRTGRIDYMKYQCGNAQES